MTQPLEEAGIASDAVAIERLACKADCYPFFLQLYGTTAFDVVQPRKTDYFGLTECDEAIANSEPSCTTYHAELLDEFIEEGEPDVARAVALDFRPAWKRNEHNVSQGHAGCRGFGTDTGPVALFASQGLHLGGNVKRRMGAGYSVTHELRD